MARLGWEIDGPDDAPVLVLGSSLGTTRDMWINQVSALSERFRVMRFDHRGHGESEVPPGPYRLEDLGRDVIALLDYMGVDRVAYAGVSLGGMIGQWLAINAPGRIDRLALICTSAYLPPAQNWIERAETVLRDGPEAIADTVVGRWFTPGFAERSPDTVAEARGMLVGTPPVGYAGCCRAIAAMDQRDGLPSITVPTLVIAATDDHSIPPDHGERIAAAVPGARFELVPGAHIAAIESADRVTALLLDHFAGATG
jgi:3-oxoadipate enol-lactonase